MHILGVGKGALFREVSSVQGCPYRGVRTVYTNIMGVSETENLVPGMGIGPRPRCFFRLSRVSLSIDWSHGTSWLRSHDPPQGTCCPWRRGLVRA